MKAVIKEGPYKGIAVADVPVPEISENEVLVEVKASGICGSDVHVYEWNGGYEWLIPYMPVTLGHEFSGIIVDVGSKVTKVKRGDRVVARTSTTGQCGVCEACKTGRRHFCEVHRENLTGWKHNGGFAKYYKSTENGVVILPEEVSYEEAAMSEPVSIGACALDDANIVIGDTCLIIGPGTIGLLTLILAKKAGAGRCIVCGTGKDEKRLEKAKELGADFIINADVQNMKDTVIEMTHGQGVDIVFEASGAAEVMQDAVDCAKMASGRIILEGIYSRRINLEFSNSIVRAARTIKGTYSGRAAWERTLEWLAYNKADVEKCTSIITHRSNINDAREAFERSSKKENIKEIFVSFE